MLARPAGVPGPAWRARNAAPNDRASCCSVPDRHAMRLHQGAVASGKHTKSEQHGVGQEEFVPWNIGPTL